MMIFRMILGLIVFQCQGMAQNGPKITQKEHSSIWTAISQGKTLKMLEKRDLYVQDCKKFEFLNKSIKKHDSNCQLRCMTYNVHMWQGKDRKNIVDDVIQNIKTTNPDVVCLQEVIWEKTFIPYVTKKFAELGYKHGGGSTFIAGKGALGNMIFSKYPLTNCFKKCFSKPVRNEYRAFTAGTIIFNNTPVKIYCLHLDVWDETGQARLEEIQELTDSIQKYDSHIKNVIFMGDFNAVRKQDYQYDINGKKVWNMLLKDDKERKVSTPTSLEDYLIKTGYKDAYELTGTRPVFTVWSGKIVDFIYFKPGGNLICKDVNAYYSSASDHVPIIVDLAVDTQNTFIKSKI